MNSYTFVPKLQHLSSQHNQTSSILQRLHQLKSSISPLNPIQTEHSSIPPNASPLNHFETASQNQPLTQYLPQQTQERLPTKQTQEGIQEYESYRKSLEKKLHYLFEKEKHIMKTQSTFEKLKQKDQTQQNFIHKTDPLKKQYTDQLLKKYSELKKQQGRLNAQENQRTNSPQNQENRQYKVHSTIETSFLQRPYSYSQKDEQFDQMERKIKMLEMKYLGTYSQLGTSPNQYDIENSRGQRIALSGISEIVPKNQAKVHKTKNKKEKTSPDRSKVRLMSSQAQTIEHVKNPSKQDKNVSKQEKNQISSPLKKKQLIKDYMDTIEHEGSDDNHKGKSQAVSMLQREFNELKQSFHALLEISKSMVERVQMNEEQRMMKKERKLKARAMLKEILQRLQEIKGELHKRVENQGEKTRKEKGQGLRTKVKSECEVRFQKSSGKALEKKTIEKIQVTTNKKTNLSIKKSMEQPQNEQEILQRKNQIQKLRKLLSLEVEHRQLVEKKLQVVYGNEILGEVQCQ